VVQPALVVLLGGKLDGSACSMAMKKSARIVLRNRRNVSLRREPSLVVEQAIVSGPEVL
jgi:hypothetical protein